MKRLTRAQLEAPLQKIARALDEALREIHGQPVGFILMTFDFGENGHLAYCANAERDGAIKAVREWLARAEAGLDTDPPGPRGRS